MSYEPYPSSGSYQQYPSGGNEMWQPPPAPRSVQNAVKLMYVGAGLSALSLIIGLATISSLKSALRTAAINAGKPLTSSQLHAAEIAGIAVIIVFGLLGVGLWIWMARANGKGRSYARIVASVLFGLNTLSVLAAVLRPNAAATKGFDLLVWIVGLGAIILLWNRESSAFYTAAQTRR